MAAKLKAKLLTIALFGMPLGAFYAFSAAISSGDIVFGIAVGTIIGLLSGLLFTFLISLFAKWQESKFRSIRCELAKKYVIIYDGAANHFVNKEAVGGWLFLTSNGLFFKSHKYNFQAHELWIPYETVKSVSAYRNLGFIKNGLLLERKGGVQNKFVVYAPKKWIKEIEQMLQPK